MPGYKEHILGSMAAGGAAITATILTGYYQLDTTPLGLAKLIGVCFLGGLFPDVDTDSKGQNILYTLLIIADGVLIYHHQYHWAAWVGWFAMLPALGHHRGWTHTWWAMLIVGAPIIIIPVSILGKDVLYSFLPFYIAFTIGYFSHLLLDRKFI